MMTKQIHRLIAIIAILLTFSTTAFAATEEFLGYDTVPGSNMTYDIATYLSYNSNTSSSLNVYQMHLWVKNLGNMSIDEYEFIAHDHNWTNNKTYYGYVTPITTGNSKHIYKIWSNVTSNTVYPKNGSPAYAYTSGAAGSGILGGHDCFWYSSYYSVGFHY